jgi:hypothetical protein
VSEIQADLLAAARDVNDLSLYGRCGAEKGLVAVVGLLKDVAGV